MKEFENIPEEIFDLLGSKSFDELATQEKKLVLKNISKEEYEDLSRLLLDFQQMDTEIQLEEQDFETFKSQILPHKNKRISGPAYYQIAASIAILFFAGLSFWDLSRNMPDESEEILWADSSSVRVEPQIDQQWLEARLNILKESTETSGKKSGLSLANDEYPEELVFDFGRATIPGGELRESF